MTSQKCQPRPSQKIHSPITMDMFKTTCPKWLRGFFSHVSKMGLLWPNFLAKKIAILVVNNYLY
jgi:hypothetical protein